MLFFYTPTRHVCTLTATSPLMVAEFDGMWGGGGGSPLLDTVSDVLYSRRGLGVKEPLVSSGAHPGSPIKGSQAVAVPHLPVCNVTVASSEKVGAMGCC